jgi:hypothetical protein
MPIGIIVTFIVTVVKNYYLPVLAFKHAEAIVHIEVPGKSGDEVTWAVAVS